MIRALGLCATLLAFTLAACGREHVLGTTTGSSSGGGGAGGSATSASSGGGGAATTTTSSSSSASSTSGVVEPVGTTKLTIVNGINDYPAIRLCFLPGDAPWPPAATGLAFAASQVVSPIAVTLPTGEDVTPWVIAGDLPLTSGKTCSQILALAGTNPALLARPLAVIPKSVWASDRSLLLVPNGCLGGPGHDDAGAKQACGQAYSSTAPTAGVVLGGMSRIPSSGHVSLQVAGASAAMPEVDVSLLPNLTDAAPTLLAPSLSQGAIAPKPPFAAFSLTELGPLEGVQIQTYAAGSTSMTSATPLSAAFANGGPGAAAFANGKNLTLVAVGAAPGLPTANWWHGLTFAVVASDP